ncbi:MAG: hypothetical protein OXG79_12710 [Chloroflexi bacterium]|nr:hypothetical protein [Chloroflexota bacterium]
MTDQASGETQIVYDPSEPRWGRTLRLQVVRCHDCGTLHTIQRPGMDGRYEAKVEVECLCGSTSTYRVDGMSIGRARR